MAAAPAAIAEPLQAILDPQLDQLVPVDHRRTCGTSDMQLCLPIDGKLLRPLTFHERSILFPDLVRKSDQFVRRLVQCKISSHDHIARAFPLRDRRNKEKIDDAVSVGIDVFVIDGKGKDDIIGKMVERYRAWVRSAAHLRVAFEVKGAVSLLDVSPRNNRDCVAIAERAWMYPGEMSLIHEIFHGTGGTRLPVSGTYNVDSKSLLLEFWHVVNRQP